MPAKNYIKTKPDYCSFDLQANHYIKPVQMHRHPHKSSYSEHEKTHQGKTANKRLNTVFSYQSENNELTGLVGFDVENSLIANLNS